MQIFKKISAKIGKIPSWKSLFDGTLIINITKWLPVILLALLLGIIYIWNVLDYDQVKSKNRQLGQEKNLLETELKLTEDSLNRMRTRSEVIKTLKSKGISDSKRPPIKVEN
ncbi:MAG: hypothetical protein LBN95_12610 [Prevotellaceae bacterium]|jgi:hypothetical protein|nr:hypothetical protein [Prevotellaceae bacterium]